MWAMGEPSGPIENGTTYIVRPRMAPGEQRGQLGLHLGRGPPVVGGAGVDLALGADEGAVLDPGDVAGVGQGEEAVRPALRRRGARRCRRRPAAASAGPTPRRSRRTTRPASGWRTPPSGRPSPSSFWLLVVAAMVLRQRCRVRRLRRGSCRLLREPLGIEPGCPHVDLGAEAQPGGPTVAVEVEDHPLALAEHAGTPSPRARRGPGRPPPDRCRSTTPSLDPGSYDLITPCTWAPRCVPLPRPLGPGWLRWVPHRTGRFPRRPRRAAQVLIRVGRQLRSQSDRDHRSITMQQRRPPLGAMLVGLTALLTGWSMAALAGSGADREAPRSDAPPRDVPMVVAPPGGSEPLDAPRAGAPAAAPRRQTTTTTVAPARTATPAVRSAPVPTPPPGPGARPSPPTTVPPVQPAPPRRPTHDGSTHDGSAGDRSRAVTAGRDTRAGTSGHRLRRAPEPTPVGRAGRPARTRRGDPRCARRGWPCGLLRVRRHPREVPARPLLGRRTAARGRRGGCRRPSGCRPRRRWLRPCGAVAGGREVGGRLATGALGWGRDHQRGGPARGHRAAGRGRAPAARDRRARHGGTAEPRPSASP